MMGRRLHAVAAAIAADCSGASAVILAISLSAVIGLAGLGAEASGWWVTKRNMQGAADAAAYSAAIAKASGATPTSYTNAARSIAGTFNFNNGTGGVSVAVNSPPTSGSHTTTSDAVEVVISQPQTALVSALFLDTGPTIATRSVALASVSGSGCVLALDRGSVTDVTESGNTTLNLNNCSLYINSPNAAALSMSGGATTNASAAYISGSYSTSGGAHLNTTNGINTGVNPINDPYANVPMPSYSGYDQTNYSPSGGSQTLNATGTTPYVFRNGLSLTGSASLTLGPGIYIVEGGVFTMSGSTMLNGTGVTIVLTSSATMSINGGATVNLVAPTSGPTAGIAIYQDRNAPTSGTDSITGGASQNITGAIYFPSQAVNYSGGGSVGGASCTQIVAYKITFTGNSNFNSNCNGVGVATIGTSSGQLVE